MESPGGFVIKHGSGDQLCLKWRDYTNNLTNVFDALLQQESFVDVTISTEAGKSLKCHKVVLSACSSYFENLFVENPCQHPIVILRDVDWKDLNTIIEYMYKGQILVGLEDLGSLLRSAESLQIRGLVELIKSLAEELSATVSRHPPKRRREEQNCTSPSPSISPAYNPATTNNNIDHGAINGETTCENNQFLGHNEDLSDVKPGIMEMIQEEQRAKMMEASQLTQNWMAAAAAAAAASSTAPPQADNNLLTYQYQLQSMWQKCWNNNTAAAAANMLQVAGVRYRERGPMKSWRPETMAEAIWSVLQEGLSLSQAARTHDIPYPTFVLYANRVHNMLGPSRNGGSPTLGELRPKGRGRPQRILLGNWPESHVRQVIRAVVFREGGISNSSEDSLTLPKQSSEEVVPAAAEVDYSPPRKVINQSPPPAAGSSGSGSSTGSSSELLVHQLRAFYGHQGTSSSSSQSSLSLMAAMGGPLSELIMKEIDFDPAMLKALMTLQGNNNNNNSMAGVFEDAEESTATSGVVVPPPKRTPDQAPDEVLLTNTEESYECLRRPSSQGLIAMSSSDS